MLRPILFSLLILCAARLAGASLEPIHTFGTAFTNLMGDHPTQRLLIGSDGNVYGVAEGGAYGLGVVFRANANLTDYSVIHHFAPGLQGYAPSTPLIEAVDGMIYGAAHGGASGNGLIYKLNKNGTGFTPVYSFAGPPDGTEPQAILQGRDFRLYGVTRGGGQNSRGTVFAMNRDGTAFSALRHLTEADTSEVSDKSLMQASDGLLYGTIAPPSSSLNRGKVFRLSPTGSGWTMVEANPSTAQGRQLVGPLLEASDGSLFGLSRNDVGTISIFKVNKAAGAFSITAALQLGNGSRNPNGGLVETMSGLLFGTAEDSFFRINKGFEPLSYFSDFWDRTKAGFVRAADGRLYVPHFESSVPNSAGFLYAYRADSVGDLQIDSSYRLSMTGGDGSRPHAPPLEGRDGFLYGTTISGGIANGGTIYKVAKDGSGFVILFGWPFQETHSGVGPTPLAALIEGSDGVLYGTTSIGGSAHSGTVFKINRNGSGYLPLHEFQGVLNDGSSPDNKLLEASDGMLYGTTRNNGFSGTIFRVNKTGTVFESLRTVGSFPSHLIQASDGFLYGTTASGIFRVSLNNAVFEEVSHFSNVGNPDGLMQASDGLLYGVASLGGTYGDGVLFQFAPATRILSVRHHFNESTSSSFNPLGQLIEGTDGRLYGATYGHVGSLFRIAKSGGGFETGFVFGGVPRLGYGLASGPVQGSDGALYGSAQDGGQINWGTLYRKANTAPQSVIPIPDQSVSCPASYTYTVDAGAFQDADGDSLAFSASGLPPGIIFDSASRKFSGTPQAPGQFAITVTATDSGFPANSATDTFVLSVQESTVPIISCPSTVVGAVSGGATTLVVAFTVTAAGACGSPPVVSCVPASGATFPFGTTRVNCTARDTANHVSSCAFDVVVGNNQPPVIQTVLASQMIVCGNPFSYTFPATTFADPEGGPLSYAASGVPAGITFNSAARTFSGTPMGSGQNHIMVTASDSGNPPATTTASFDLIIQDPTPPTITCPARTVRNVPGSSTFATVSFAATATDACTPQPAVTCNPASGSNFPLGTTRVNCSAADGAGNTGNCSFEVVVRHDQPPTVPNPIPDLSILCATPIPYTFPANTFADPDGDSLTYITSPLPQGVLFSASSRTFSFNGVSAGTYSITVTATDEGAPAASVTDTFQLNVLDTTAPVLICPSELLVPVPPGTMTIPVNLGVVATDNCDSQLLVQCQPASGSAFSVGTTQVACTARDGANNLGSCSFPVVVRAELFTALGSPVPGVTEGAVAWGDFNGDGLLDLLVTGATNNLLGRMTRLYRNTGSSLVDVGLNLPALSGSAAAWADFDNDGDLDFALSGFNGTNSITRVYRNDTTSGGGATFVDSKVNLLGLSASALAWGDYDGDGWPDLVVTGTADGATPVTKLYHNCREGHLREVSSNLPNLVGGSVAWADFSNDGFADLAMSGYDGIQDSTRILASVGDGRFVSQSEVFAGTEKGSLAWADHDNDGDLDLLATGSQNGVPTTALYIQGGRNRPVFTLASGTGLPNLKDSAAAWGDFDNDGWPDLLLTGNTGSGSPLRIARVYRNNRNGTFTDVQGMLPGLERGDAVWGDQDNDGRLDLILCGFTGSSRVLTIFHNNSPGLNTPPTPPGNLASSLTTTGVKLSWNAGIDAQTPMVVLSYNVRITGPVNSTFVASPSSLPSGQRQIVCPGNSGVGLDHLVRNSALPSGWYSWDVQAVDVAFAGSPFSTNAFFFLEQPQITKSTLNTNGEYLLRFTGTTPAYRVQATTNLVDCHLSKWEDLGQAQLIGPDLYEFRETNSPLSNRFYRLVFPASPEE